MMHHKVWWFIKSAGVLEVASQMLIKQYHHERGSL
jgi:hypothetical protein